MKWLYLIMDELTSSREVSDIYNSGSPNDISSLKSCRLVENGG